MNKQVKNSTELDLSPQRHVALELIETGLAAINTAAAVRAAVRLNGNQLLIKERLFSLEPTAKLVVVAIGKCANDAALALEEILAERLSGGIAVDVHQEKRLRKIESFAGDHPFPSEKNIDATKQIMRLLETLTEHDLALLVVSGGGSTLLCQPDNFTCYDEVDLLKCLFSAGATIQEINIIRKHLSLARGGYLAKYAYPARVVGLIFSDVPGDRIEFVASGPTVFDNSRRADAVAILEKYRAQTKCHFRNENFFETPKDEKYFSRVSNILLVSNQLALEAMAAAGRALDLDVAIRTDCLTGEARIVGAQLAKDLAAADDKTLWLYGGETTVQVRGEGHGGRNQELVLAALPNLATDDLLIISLASDGVDNSDQAGAIGDTITIKKAEQLELDSGQYLADNNAYEFFQPTGAHIFTGPTGANVSDLIIALKYH